jgi:hypothetical protein
MNSNAISQRLAQLPKATIFQTKEDEGGPETDIQGINGHLCTWEIIEILSFAFVDFKCTHESEVTTHATKMVVCAKGHSLDQDLTFRIRKTGLVATINTKYSV